MLTRVLDAARGRTAENGPDPQLEDASFQPLSNRPRSLLDELSAHDELAQRRAEIAQAAALASAAQAQHEAYQRATVSAPPMAPPSPRRPAAEQLDMLSEELDRLQRSRATTPVSNRPQVAAVSPATQESAPPLRRASPFAMLGFDAILSRILRAWAIIVLFALVGAALAALWALSKPNEYQSIAEILIEPRGIQVLENTVRPQGLNSEATVAYAQSQVRIITSGAVIEPVIRDLELDQDPEFNGTEGGPLGRLLGLIGVPYTSEVAESERLESVREYFYRNLYVNRVNQTFNIQIGMTTADPAKSARIANAIAQTYMRDQAGSNSRAALDASENLTERSQVLRAKVQAAEEAVEAHKQQFDLVDADGKLVSDVQLARLNEQLSLARVQAGDARTRAQAAEAADPADALSGSLPSSITSEALSQLRVDYNRALGQRNRLATKLGQRHPLLIEAGSEVASARRAIESEVGRIVRSVREDYARALAREEDLRSQVNVAKASAANDSEAKVKLRELEATLGANREIYSTVLQRLRQTGEQGNIETDATRLLSEALPPARKSGPARKAMVVAGAASGATLGVLLSLSPLFFSVLRALAGGSGDGGRNSAPLRASPAAAYEDDDLYGDASTAATGGAYHSQPVAKAGHAAALHQAPVPAAADFAAFGDARWDKSKKVKSKAKQKAKARRKRLERDEAQMPLPHMSEPAAHPQQHLQPTGHAYAPLTHPQGYAPTPAGFAPAGYAPLMPVHAPPMAPQYIPYGYAPPMHPGYAQPVQPAASQPVASAAQGWPAMPTATQKG